MEMHTVHLAQEHNETANIKYAAVGVFFSVKDYSKDISTAENDTVKQFFNHLKFDAEGEPIVDIISYGKLMSLVNFD
jgi:hypothetical protein